MSLGLIGRKVGMMRIFTDEGDSIPVTVVDVSDNRVTQVKTTETDGYTAVQVAFGKRRPSRVNKAAAGHFAKAGVEAGTVLREFTVDESKAAEVKAGDVLPATMFEAGQKIDVQGVSIGKGYAGTIKRHNFASGRATHGNSLSHNVPGSIGMNQDPGRVFPGKKMTVTWVTSPKPYRIWKLHESTQNAICYWLKVLFRVPRMQRLLFALQSKPKLARGHNRWN